MGFYMAKFKKISKTIITAALLLSCLNFSACKKEKENFPTANDLIETGFNQSGSHLAFSSNLLLTGRVSGENVEQKISGETEYSNGILKLTLSLDNNGFLVQNYATNLQKSINGIDPEFNIAYASSKNILSSIKNQNETFFDLYFDFSNDNDDLDIYLNKNGKWGTSSVMYTEDDLIENSINDDTLNNIAAQSSIKNARYNLLDMKKNCNLTAVIPSLKILCKNGTVCQNDDEYIISTKINLTVDDTKNLLAPIETLYAISFDYQYITDMVNSFELNDIKLHFDKNSKTFKCIEINVPEIKEFIEENYDFFIEDFDAKLNISILCDNSGLSVPPEAKSSDKYANFSDLLFGTSDTTHTEPLN